MFCCRTQGKLSGTVVGVVVGGVVVEGVDVVREWVVSHVGCGGFGVAVGCCGCVWVVWWWSCVVIVGCGVVVVVGAVVGAGVVVLVVVVLCDCRAHPGVSGGSGVVCCLETSPVWSCLLEVRCERHAVVC